jgi:hypothetical protein
MPWPEDLSKLTIEQHLPRRRAGDDREVDGAKRGRSERSHGKFFLNKSPVYPMNVQRPAG